MVKRVNHKQTWFDLIEYFFWYEHFNPYAADDKFGQYEIMEKSWKITETLAHGYSFEIAQRKLSNEYQHDRVSTFFKNLCFLVLWTKVA